MARVLIKKLDSAVELPAYKTEGASGMDLMALLKKPINLKANSSCLVPTGLAIAFSSDFEIQIRPRSGLAAKKNIGFNSDYNEVVIHYKNKSLKNEVLPYKRKSEISEEIVDRIIDQLN